MSNPNTLGLYHFENNGADSSTYNNPITMWGTPTYSSSIYKFGNYSVHLPYGSIQPYTSIFPYQWTVDFWFYPDWTAMPQYQAGGYMFSCGTNTDPNHSSVQGIGLYAIINYPLCYEIFLEVDMIGGAVDTKPIYIYRYDEHGNTVNAWYHIAAVSELIDTNSNPKPPSLNPPTLAVNLYLNGNSVDAPKNCTGYFPVLNNTMYFGAGEHGIEDFSSGPPGYYDELRISSTARWTSDFTPPTAPYSE